MVQSHEEGDLIDLQQTLGITETVWQVLTSNPWTQGRIVTRGGDHWWNSDLVVEADVDEVSVLQTGALQDGGKMAAQVVSSDDVIVGRMTPAADTHILIKVWTILTQRQHETAFDFSPDDLLSQEYLALDVTEAIFWPGLDE